MIAGLPHNETEGLTEEEARYWWDRVLSWETKRKFVDQYKYLSEREKEDLRNVRYDEFTPALKKEWKDWLMMGKAHKGISYVDKGKTHEDGGIIVEVEKDEQVLTSGVADIKDKIVCTGTGEGIGSALNELGGGAKWSNEGFCKIYKRNQMKMQKGGKISSKEIRDYVSDTKPFKGEGHIKAENVKGKYVVYSYGYYPILVYDGIERKWYENSEKFSKTTSKQLSQSRPLGIEAIKKTTSELEEIIGESRTQSSHFYQKGAKIKNHLRKGRKIHDKILEQESLKQMDSSYLEKGGYVGKTPEQVWKSWSADQKIHFLTDHDKEINESWKREGNENTSLNSEKWYASTYSELPEAIKQSIKGHMMMGQYQGGGKIQEYGNYFKIGSGAVKAFSLLQALEMRDFADYKVVSHNDILIFGKSESLQNFLDKYSIPYDEFESYEELRDWMISQLPAKAQKVIKQSNEV